MIKFHISCPDNKLMNHLDVKFLHQLLAITLLYSVMLMIYNPKLKLAKVFFFFTNLAMVGSGILSLDQRELTLDDSLPVWIYAKFAVLILLTFLPLFMVKFLPKLASKLSCVYFLLIAAGVFLGVFKP